MRRRRAEVMWPTLISAHVLMGDFFFLYSRWCGKFSLSLCQIHFQDDFLAQLKSVTCFPITGHWKERERERELYTPPHSVNIITRQFVLHNLTPSVKKCAARGEERREKSGLMCSLCHFSYWSWVVKQHYLSLTEGDLGYRKVWEGVKNLVRFLLFSNTVKYRFFCCLYFTKAFFICYSKHLVLGICSGPRPERFEFWDNKFLSSLGLR